MRQPTRSTPWDAAIERRVKPLFYACLVFAALVFIKVYWDARCACEDYCIEQGGWMVEFEYVQDSRFRSNPDRCVCRINSEHVEFTL
ncbi:hypothetical protein CHH28_01145 [Bacterioplanes sanyensis]|uniref:Uncharacterized protein n=1 Tax=Bacterioplanes sanyensis TaxID=1249553 RepID=A0A222FG36_9GAMM|nr:hypothetical protein [Bacterioplanes sanyensis]ASP37371.1 hypothetical protein CHH28_01145 [Bacterioplanes sanyensis]